MVYAVPDANTTRKFAPEARSTVTTPATGVTVTYPGLTAATATPATQASRIGEIVSSDSRPSGPTVTTWTSTASPLRFVIPGCTEIVAAWSRFAIGSVSAEACHVAATTIPTLVASSAVRNGSVVIAVEVFAVMRWYWPRAVPATIR